MEKWQRIKEGIIQINRFRKMKEVRCRLPNGHEDDFYLWMRGKVVCALVITNDNKVVLAKQYRLGPDKVLLELPGGRVDKNETAEQAIVREVLEETGYQGKSRYLLSNCDDAWSDMERFHFVITDAVRLQNPTPEYSENIEVELLGLDDFRKHVKTGQLTDVETAYLGLDYLQKL